MISRYVLIRQKWWLHI